MTKEIFWLTIFSLLLLPALPIAPGMPKVRLDDFLPLVWLFFVCIGFSGQIVLSRPAFRRLALFVIFAACVVFSITVGMALGFDASTADYNQLIRLLKYAAVYLMAVTYFRRHDNERALRRILQLGILLFALTLTQYFNVLGLNERYVPIIAPTQFETLVGGYPNPRPVGMVGNPNELAFLFIILSFVAVFYFIKTKRKSTALYLAAFLIGIFLTLSRSAMLAYAVGFALLGFLLLFPTTYRTLGKKVAAMVVLAIAAPLILNYGPVYDQFTWRFARAFSAEDASVTVRVENWQENIDIIKDHPFVGVGPLRRADVKAAADNEWLLMIRSYGLIGTFALILLLVVPALSIENTRAKKIAIALIAATFAYMLPAAAFHSLVLFPVLMVAMAALEIKPQPTQPHHT